MDCPLLIVGASTRAAAFSALRAGLQPWCADLFGDADLQACCRTWTLAAKEYPDGCLQAAREAPPGPWIYTGGLENRPRLIGRLTRLRTLWGNGAAVLAIVRLPLALAELLHNAGIPCPAVKLRPPPSRPGRWLVKPLTGAGGAGIRFHSTGIHSVSRQRLYYQEFIEGDACAAVYLGDGAGAARLLGVTRQLIGELWLHAAPFQYCGSLGPLPLAEPVREALVQLGNALVKGSGLRGLFGVDFILRDGVPWPVEINPRYSASLEVLEYAGDFSALALHRVTFDPGAPAVSTPPISASLPWIGKAILFARDRLIFPSEGPWQAVLRHPGPIGALPAFADISPAGQAIARGAPVLTIFARADSSAACLDALQHVAADLDQAIFGP